MKKSLFTAWNEIALWARQSDPALVQIDRTAAWLDCVGQLHKSFASYAGEDTVAERFQVPPDYADYMALIGGGWEWKEGMDQSLFTASQVCNATANDYRILVTERDEDDGPQDDGFWLTIGWYSEKHGTLLCCDRAKAYYGSVFDGHDDHPWLNGLTSPTCTVIAPSFEAFLQHSAFRLTNRSTGHGASGRIGVVK